MSIRHDRTPARSPYMEAFDRLFLRTVQAYAARYGSDIAETCRQLSELLPDKVNPDKNLVAWYYRDDEFSRSRLLFIRLVQLTMKQDQGTTFTLHIYVTPNSELLPQNKARENYPFGDIIFWGDPLVRIITPMGPKGEVSQYAERYFGESGRIYLIMNKCSVCPGSREPITLSLKLPVQL